MGVPAAMAISNDDLAEIYDYDQSGTFAEIRSNNVLPWSNTLYSVALGDVDGDGALEVVAGSRTRDDRLEARVFIARLRDRRQRLQRAVAAHGDGVVVLGARLRVVSEARGPSVGADSRN